MMHDIMAVSNSPAALRLKKHLGATVKIVAPRKRGRRPKIRAKSPRKRPGPIPEFITTDVLKRIDEGLTEYRKSAYYRTWLRGRRDTQIAALQSLLITAYGYQNRRLSSVQKDAENLRKRLYEFRKARPSSPT